jgi:NSS family neurotransmitter:Na+ symporter
MSQNTRDQWASRKGFIFATIGAAIGLGNLWRFPFQAYNNGGGAFLLPYFFALLTAGIPLMILEYGFGNRMRSGAAFAFSRLRRSFEFLGWWQVMIPLLVMMFYSSIVAWSLNYMIFSLDLSWGTNPGKFFGVDFLHVSDSPFNLSTVNWHILATTAIVWFGNWFITRNGISRGIEKAAQIFTPLLLLLMIGFMIRGVTLEGASLGLDYLFKPDFSILLKPQVWVAAYAQVFFSATLGVGVMIAYASYLPNKSDIVNNACLTVLSNSCFDLIAGITVFSTLGFVAHSMGVDFTEVAKGGPGIAFVAFPQAISQMPFGQSVIGVLFFFCLFIAGLSSSISMLEAFCSAALDKFNLSRKGMITIISLLGFCGSALYTTGAGVLILDIVDHFVGNYGIATCGLLEAFLIGWFYNASKMRTEVNAHSDFRIGVWWEYCIKFLTPAVLGYMTVMNIIEEFTKPYGGYPMSAIMAFGWSVALGMPLVGLLLMRKPWRNLRRSPSSRQGAL